MSTRVRADSRTWANPAGGSWQDGNNWFPIFVPTSGDDAQFTLVNTTYAVTFSADAEAATVLANTGSITFSLGGFTLATGSLDTSTANAFSFNGGTIAISGGRWTPKLSSIGVNGLTGSPFSNAFEINGASGNTSYLSLLSGASLSTSASNLFVGETSNKGQFIVNASTATLTAAAGRLFVGAGRNVAAAEGSLAISNGGQVVTPSTYVGSVGGKGWVTVSGNSTLSASTDFYVGNSVLTGNAGEGTVTVSSGGMVKSTSTAIIGFSGGKGLMTVDGGTFSANTLYVGHTNATPLSNGTLNAINGGSIISSSVGIGVFSGVGTALLSGSNTRWSNSGDFSIGTLIAGVGSSAGTGTVSLSNNATLTNTNTLVVGNNGRLLLASGATLETGTFSQSGNPANFSWSGGTLKINKGTTAADSALLLTVPNTGTLGGIGNVQRAVTAASGGTLAPGNSVGSISTGALTLQTSSTLSVEVDLDADKADKVNVSGTVDLSGIPNGFGGVIGGANLQLSLVQSGTTPFVNPKTYILIDNDSTDAVIGVFAGLLENTPYTHDGLTYKVNYGAGTGNDVAVTITAVPEPGALLALVAFSGLIVRRPRRAAASRAA